MFLGGPPLVKMATGEESDDEELGGAEMHARSAGWPTTWPPTSSTRSASGREIVRRPQLAQARARRRGGRPTSRVHDRRGPARASRRPTCACRSTRARSSPGSSTAREFDEFKPLLRPDAWSPAGPRSTATRSASWPTPAACSSTRRRRRRAQFIQLANQTDTPLLFLQNTTGYMVGKDYEQRGIIKDGAQDDQRRLQLDRAAPHGDHGRPPTAPGNYGMCGRAYDPRFLFAWPNAKTAVMGPQQLAGVLSIVAAPVGRRRRAGRSTRRPTPRCGQAVEEQIERESLALFITGAVYDDGIIDPRDTRTVLGIGPVGRPQRRGPAAQRGYGVFRM